MKQKYRSCGKGIVLLLVGFDFWPRAYVLFGNLDCLAEHTEVKEPIKRDATNAQISMTLASSRCQQLSEV